MKVLVVGGGAREHALAWKLHFSPKVSALYCAPGNAGISLMAHTAPVSATDVRELRRFVVANGIELTVVGPEDALAAGIVDQFHEANLRIFGPTQAAAQIESSKVWAKSLMQRHNIPTARWIMAATPEAALAALDEFSIPVVIKADGLAGGKGAVVCATREQAEANIDEIMVQRAHGEAGRRLVIEEFLEGRELSVFALADGRHVLPLIAARDYKPLLDGDEGPNTGGMGGYTRPSYATPELLDQIFRTIIEPVITAMAAEGAPYVGVLYTQVMVTPAGPKVVEFNARWGDPEAQLIMPLLKTDLVDLIDACIDGTLDQITPEWHDAISCGVAIASPGYPQKPQTGLRITGLEDLDEGILAFHAATKLLTAPEPARGFLRRGVRRTTEFDVGMVTDGGRVLTLVATGPTLAEAREKVYRGVERISFDGVQFRKDIGADDTVWATGPGGLYRPGPLPPRGVTEPTTAAVPLPDLGEVGLATDRFEPEAGSALSTGQDLPQDAPDAADEPASSTPTADPRPYTAPSYTSQTYIPLTYFEGVPMQSSGSSPKVAVLMGSESDRPIMDETTKVLDALGIAHEVHVMSAHRTPERVRQFAQNAEARGLQVIIAGAGGAAHLPGVIAAQTILPVIGIPVAGSSMMGLDSLLSIVQMPGGVPVATVAVGSGGARNAGYLAAAIIGQTDANVRDRYREFRNQQSGGELGG